MRVYITILLYVSSLITYGQAITGKVTDAFGTSLPGVSIAVEGKNTGVITDFDGNYSINAIQGEVLVFTFLGLQTQKVTVGSNQVIDITMQEDVAQLDEVVVTALGVEKEKRSLGYAIQSLKADEITRGGNPDALRSIQGKVAGVNITNTSGAAGAGSNIVIRGITSLDPTSNNQPLFIIDGIPISNDAPTGNLLPSTGSNAPSIGGVPSSSEQFSFTNRAQDINPNDIADISILKGPAATALYGLRAANGVVIITTKRGQQGEVKFNLRNTFGWSRVNKVPEVQKKWREGRGGQIVSVPNDNAPTGYDYLDGRRFGFWTLGPEYAPGEPIYDNFQDLFENAFTTNTTFSGSGGNEKYRYYSSVSGAYDGGIVPNTDFSRVNLKLSGNISVTDKFLIDPSISYIVTDGRLPNGGDKSIMSSLSFWTPTFDVNDYLLPNGGERDYSNGIIDNPRYFAEVSYLDSRNNRLLANTRFKYEINDWAKVEYQIGIDNYHDNRERFVPPDVDVGTATNGFIVREAINYNELTSNLYLTLTKEFNEDLKASFLVGNQISDIEQRRVTNRAEGLNPNNQPAFAEADNFFDDSRESQRRIIGLFGDLQLEYKNTLFLNVTGRNDWSSTLPKDNRSFFYPSANLSYILSQTLEDTEALPDFLSFAKLRASYAEVGKDAPPASIGVFYDQPLNFPFGTVGGASQLLAGGSEGLKPERTSAIEFGGEFKFFENRFGIDFAYYEERSKDQIVNVPVAQSSGFNTFLLNAGEIKNIGYEVLVNTSPIKTKDFSWDIILNWSQVEGEVLSLPEQLDEIIFVDSGFTGVISKVVVGGSPGDLFGYIYNYDDNGNLIIADDGFPRINTTERVKVGNAFPDWLGSINSTVRWKGLSFSFLLERKQGGDLYDSGQRNGIRNGILEITEPREVEMVFDGILENGSPNTTPVLIDENYYRSSSIYNRASEVLVQDASWWRLRNVTLSYDLPSKMLSKTPFEHINVSFTGNNLWLDTPFRGYDPEGSQFSAGTNAYGFTGLNIPSTKSYQFGININF